MSEMAQSLRRFAVDSIERSDVGASGETSSQDYRPGIAAIEIQGREALNGVMRTEAGLSNVVIAGGSARYGPETMCVAGGQGLAVVFGQVTLSSLMSRWTIACRHLTHEISDHVLPYDPGFVGNRLDHHDRQSAAP
jgi:hypothetical protein